MTLGGAEDLGVHKSCPGSPDGSGGTWGHLHSKCRGTLMQGIKIQSRTGCFCGDREKLAYLTFKNKT